MCSTIAEQSVKMASTPFNICENKGKVESILNESLKMKLDSTRFHKLSTFFTLSTMLEDLFEVPTHLTFAVVQLLVFTHVINSHVFQRKQKKSFA